MNTMRGLNARSQSPADTLRVLWRTALWIGHCLLRRPATVSVGERKARMTLPPRFGEGGIAMFVLRERYEPEVGWVERTLKEGMVFVDGGANLGIYTVVASRAVGDSGRVLSFEPGGTTYANLMKSATLNNPTNVHARQKALGDEVASTVLYHTRGHAVSYSLNNDEGADTVSEPIETTTIDAVMAEEGLDRLDFVKLDIEGAEERALRGAANSIEQHKPIVMFEVLEYAAQSTDAPIDGAWRFLAERGYTFSYVDRSGVLHPCPAPRNGNIVAQPA